MTKDEIENIIKRYPYITAALKRGLNFAVFYVGNRKFVIEITEEVKTVYEIVKKVFDNEKSELIHFIIKEMIMGESDIYIMSHLPYSRHTYYEKKKAIIAKIYDICISRRLVTEDEIMREEIAS